MTYQPHPLIHWSTGPPAQVSSLLTDFIFIDDHDQLTGAYLGLTGFDDDDDNPNTTKLFGGTPEVKGYTHTHTH